MTNVLGLAQHPVTGVLYGIRKTTNPFARELVTINPLTGATTLVGNWACISRAWRLFLVQPMQIQSIGRNGSDLTLTWSGGTPTCNVQNRPSLNTGSWSTIITNSLLSTTITNGIVGLEGYFRVSSQ